MVAGTSDINCIEFYTTSSRDAMLYSKHDLNTPSNRHIAFYLNGCVERMRINYLGNVGIGTTDPLYKLHVDGDINITTDLNQGSNKTSTLTYQIGTANSFSSSVYKFGSKSLALTQTSNSYLLVRGLGTTPFTSSWTIEFWYYPTSYTVLTSPFSTVNWGYCYLQNSASSGLFSWYIGSASRVSEGTLIHTNTPNLNAWNHIAMTWDATNGKYWLGLNGVAVSLTSSNAIPSTELGNVAGICFGNAMRNQSGSFYTENTYGFPCVGNIDEIRISNTARYTATTYTTPTTVFISDASTSFLNHLEGDFITSQDTPTTTTGFGSVHDSSGNLTTIQNITSATGSISLTTGDIKTQYGNVQSYSSFQTSTPAWSIGPTILFNSNVDSLSFVGCYMKTSAGWDIGSGTGTHSIRTSYLCQNDSQSMYQGTITIFANNKSSTTPKSGIIRADLYYLYGSTLTAYTISTTKSASLTSFSISTLNSGLFVSTDSDTYVCWHFIGSY